MCPSQSAKHGTLEIEMTSQSDDQPETSGPQPGSGLKLVEKTRIVGAIIASGVMPGDLTARSIAALLNATRPRGSDRTPRTSAIRLGDPDLDDATGGTIPHQTTFQTFGETAQAL